MLDYTDVYIGALVRITKACRFNGIPSGDWGKVGRIVEILHRDSVMANGSLVFVAEVRVLMIEGSRTSWYANVHYLDKVHGYQLEFPFMHKIRAKERAYYERWSYEGF